ncbi:DUF5336 domain-containing protein [Pseudonocardia lacus]|uniref:DUF5336 domain-containing protein n=1 Tax=Pseudonocardia lacus TaxID=2835865 RepID=UPI001BDC3B18|nr:DUF5336 domain-containing protein [Pseudonocardia lacus]
MGPPHQPGPPGQPAPRPARPAGDGPTGTARLLALGAAGAAVLVYLLGFFTDDSGLLGALAFAPLLVGGGLLAGASVLPKAGRVLLPGAVIALTGALLLLQLVASGNAPGIIIVMLIVGLLEAGAAIVAYLMDAGVVSAPAGVPRQRQQPPGYGPPPGYPPQGYGAPPGGYGPPSSPAMPSAFGATPPPSQGGWGQGPGPLSGAHEVGARPTPDVDRTEPREDTSATSATTAIPIVSGDRGARPADETNFFDDGGAFSKAQRPSPEPSEETTRSATAAMPAVGSDRSVDGPTDRGPSDRGYSDETSAFGEGGMFAESTPRPMTPEPGDEGGGGRHGQPVDGERNERSTNGVPPNEQTWFMPPGDRPNPNS